ncbi:hypothetical protein BH11MYX3_BH11MYX3_00430 [soil metagenome]
MAYTAIAMAITYVIDERLQRIRETWAGSVSGPELGAYWQRYLADPRVLELRRTPNIG